MKYALLFLTMIITSFPSLALPNFDICNLPTINKYYSINDNSGHCIDTRQNLSLVINLSSEPLELYRPDMTALFLYPSEYVYVEHKFALNNAMGRLIIRPESDTIVIKSSIPEGVSARSVPAVVVGAFVGGTLGVMSELGASGGNSSFRSVSIAAFSGPLRVV